MREAYACPHTAQHARLRARLRARPWHHDGLARYGAALVPQHRLAVAHVKLGERVAERAGRLGRHAVRVAILQALARPARSGSGA